MYAETMSASKTPSHRRNGAARPRRRAPAWAELPEEELLDLRLCDLELDLSDTVLQARIERLHDELSQRDIVVRPHCWLSDEWFSPDGVPGIGIPFYLAHPRLIRLERKQMLEVEGATKDWCMKILRHEAGHAVDTSFRLRRRRDFREVFGRCSQPYPEFYQPKPFSRSYVMHLDRWYAQSHPTEDFAETFAVWLKPRSRWRTQYEGWPAMRKLKYVDRVMNELAGAAPAVRSRRREAPLHHLRMTLREHYEQKRDHYGIGKMRIYDGDLKRLFSDAPDHRRRLSAATFLRRHRKELRRTVSLWTGEYQYTIDQVLGEMLVRCEELDLHLDRPERLARRDAFIVLTIQTMQFLHGGHHRLAL